MTTLTVATFNVRNSRAFDWLNSWPFRRRATAAATAALDADVVGLQEVFARPLRYLLERTDGYESHGEGRDGGRRGEHCSVLVRTSRLEVLRHQTLWYGDSPDRPGTRLLHASFPRVATMVHVRDRATSVEFDVWNTHLDERVDVNRTRSSAQLARWLQRDRPTVVLGDFNAQDVDADVFDPLRAAGLRHVLEPGGAGTAHNFTGRVDVPRIDHIMVSRHWDVNTAEVVTRRPRGRLPSDHWPVRSVVTLRSA